MNKITNVDRLRGSIGPQICKYLRDIINIKKVTKKSNICDNICDIECSSVKLIFKESGILSNCMQSFNRVHAFSTVLQLIQSSIDF